MFHISIRISSSHCHVLCNWDIVPTAVETPMGANPMSEFLAQSIALLVLSRSVK